MTPHVFAVQYLEALPTGATREEILGRLSEAFDRLPISLVLLGWNLPPQLEDAIAEETNHRGAELYRWQPWLTRAAYGDLPLDWAVIGANSLPIPGYHDDPSFTFICPNRKEVTGFLEEYLAGIAARGIFHGIFLDRMRFPSPSGNPIAQLGCFCKDCRQLGLASGLDLDKVRLYLKSVPSSRTRATELVRSLFSRSNSLDNPVDALIEFRTQSIFRAIITAYRQAKSLDLSIGLDCFSPTLARMQGQDLSRLDVVSDWIKLMIYPQTFSPAGLSFELWGLATWLISIGWSEPGAIKLLSDATRLSFPKDLLAVRNLGFNSAIISQEVDLGYQLGVTNLYAGLALSVINGQCKFSIDRITCDIMATRNAQGLVISWDLWHTPLDYLDAIRTILE